jgi:hypothetical protein
MQPSQRLPPCTRRGAPCTSPVSPRQANARSLRSSRTRCTTTCRTTSNRTAASRHSHARPANSRAFACDRRRGSARGRPPRRLSRLCQAAHAADSRLQACFQLSRHLGIERLWLADVNRLFGVPPGSRTETARRPQPERAGDLAASRQPHAGPSRAPQKQTAGRSRNTGTRRRGSARTSSTNPSIQLAALREKPPTACFSGRGAARR